MKINTDSLKFARELRKNGTPSEKLLWKEIQGSKLGFKFIRQQPIGAYTVDFLCRKEMIVIEIDGDSHDGKNRIRRCTR